MHVKSLYLFFTSTLATLFHNYILIRICIHTYHKYDIERLYEVARQSELGLVCYG